MTYLTPIWAQDGKYPAQLDRLALGAAFSVGVVDAAHCKPTQRQAGTNMSVDIAPGIVAVPDAQSGLYLCVQDEVVNVPVAAPPAAGTTRIDRLVARVYDSQASGQPVGLSWQYEMIPGTPASTDAKPPAIPAYSYRIADITVAAGTAAITNAMIADWRGLAVAANQTAAVNSVATTPYSAISAAGWSPAGSTDTEMIGPCLVFTHLQHDVSLTTGNSMKSRILVTTRGYSEVNPEQQLFNNSQTNFIDRQLNTQTSMSIIDAGGTVHCEAQIMAVSGYSSPVIHGGIYMSMIIPTNADSLKMFGNGANTNPVRPPWWDDM